MISYDLVCKIIANEWFRDDEKSQAMIQKNCFSVKIETCQDLRVNLLNITKDEFIRNVDIGYKQMQPTLFSKQF